MRVLLVLAVLAGGCATPYQQMGRRGGYADSQLSERVFEISFAGNGYTGRMTVEAYVMRRAAEVALARGFVGFLEVGGEGHTDESLAYYNNNAYVVSKHSDTKRIYLLTAEEMREAPTAIDASMVMSRWAAEIRAEAAQAAKEQATELELCRRTLASPAARENRPKFSAACREKLGQQAQQQLGPDDVLPFGRPQP